MQLASTLTALLTALGSVFISGHDLAVDRMSGLLAPSFTPASRAHLLQTPSLAQPAPSQTAEAQAAAASLGTDAAQSATLPTPNDTTPNADVNTPPPSLYAPLATSAEQQPATYSHNVQPPASPNSPSVPLSLVSSLAQQLATLTSIVRTQQMPPSFPQQVAASGNGGTYAGGYVPAAAANISQLQNTSITTPVIVNPAINGGTLTGVSVSAANLSASGIASLATTTITGNLTTSGNATFGGTITAGTLAVAGISSGGAVAAPYFTATSTNATSTFAGDLTISGNTTLQNATTTSLFVTSLFSSLNATIGALTATSSLAVYNSSAFGATGTTTIDSAGNTAIAGTLNVTGKTTLGTASATNISSSYASSTQGYFGSLSLGSLSGILKATAGAVATSLVNLASDITGILGVANGGTGWAAIQSGALVYGNGTNALATTTAGTPGQVLARLNGIPTWTATTTFSNGLAYANGNVTNTGILALGPLNQMTNGTATFATSTTGTDFTITGSGSTITFNIPTASASNRGLLSSSDWSAFAGKISSSSLSATFPLSYNSGAGAFAFNGLSTSSAATMGNIPYFSGANTFANVATTSPAAGPGISLSGTSALVGGGGLTITNAGVLSLTQNGGGTAQTGAITLATSSAATSNGVTVGSTITNSGSTFTFTPTVSVANIPNSALQNSTISGVALGSNLFNVSAANGSLTFSGAYNGSAAQTVALNLNNANAWTALQTFANATTTLLSATYASSTNLFAGTAATTNLKVTSITSALHLADAAGNVTAYSGTSCTNQFIRSLNGAGVAACASVNLASDVTGTLGYGNGGTGTTTAPVGQLLYGGSTAFQSVATTSATIGSSLSYSGTFGALVGGAAGTLSLNLNNANAWTALQTFANASSTLFSAYGPAYFGATATSSFNSAGQLALVANGLTVGSNQLVVSGGDVGIGTTTPNYKLDVWANGTGATPAASGSVDATSYQRIARAGGAAALDIGIIDSGAGYLQARNQSNFATDYNLLLNPNGGNVGIGTTAPADPLDVNGLVRAGAFRSRTGTGTIGPNGFNIYWTGSTAQLWIDGANVGNISLSSDVRVKKNIETLTATSGLAIIDTLNPVTFNWKDDASGTTTQYGFIAQDVQKVVPDLVTNTSLKSTSTPDGLLHLDYNGLFAPIIKSIQQIAAITDQFRTNLIAWLGSADNGIEQIFTKQLAFSRATGEDLTLTHELCVTDGANDNAPLCLTKTQLAALLSQAASAATPAPAPSSGRDSLTNSAASSSASATLTVNGSNPQTWTLNTPYTDNLGALFTHGGQSETIYSTSTIDTASAATTTIDYWANYMPDPASTSSQQWLHATRDVVIVAPANDNPPPLTATGTDATTSAVH